MRSNVRLIMVAAVATCAACGSEGRAAGDDVPPGSVPSAVSCADAAELRQRSLDDRRRSEVLASDQAKIDAGNRARFLASLALIADLKCRVGPTDIDGALAPALEAAHAAANAAGFYQRTLRWVEADYVATEVIVSLVERLPAVDPN